MLMNRLYEGSSLCFNFFLFANDSENRCQHVCVYIYVYNIYVCVCLCVCVCARALLRVCVVSKSTLKTYQKGISPPILNIASFVELGIKIMYEL
jgi:hypothetical protein